MENESCSKCTFGYTTAGGLFECNSCKKMFHKPCLGQKFNNAVDPDRVIVCGDCDIKVRIESLHNELSQLNPNFDMLQNRLSVIAREEFIYETIDRIKRAKNIIVYNLAESAQQTEVKRQKADRLRITREISKFCLVDLHQIHVHRIGGTITNVPRPLKVCLKREYDVRKIMRYCHRCVSGLQFALDKTVLQRRIAKDAVDRLHFLRHQGNNKITVKYVRGMPIIVEDTVPAPQPNILNDGGMVYNGELAMESDEDSI